MKCQIHPLDRGVQHNGRHGVARDGQRQRGRAKAVVPVAGAENDHAHDLAFDQFQGKAKQRNTGALENIYRVHRGRRRHVRREEQIGGVGIAHGSGTNAITGELKGVGPRASAGQMIGAAAAGYETDRCAVVAGRMQNQPVMVRVQLRVRMEVGRRVGRAAIGDGAVHQFEIPGVTHPTKWGICPGKAVDWSDSRQRAASVCRRHF